MQQNLAESDVTQASGAQMTAEERSTEHARQERLITEATEAFYSLLASSRRRADSTTQQSSDTNLALQLRDRLRSYVPTDNKQAQSAVQDETRGRTWHDSVILAPVDGAESRDTTRVLDLIFTVVEYRVETRLSFGHGYTGSVTRTEYDGMVEIEMRRHLGAETGLSDALNTIKRDLHDGSGDVVKRGDGLWTTLRSKVVEQGGRATEDTLSTVGSPATVRQKWWPE
jgi:hypothetical protein